MLHVDPALSRFATTLRRGRATAPAAQLGPRPEQALVLYEFEECPMCRRVREALTDLALDVEVRPCPRGGSRFRGTVDTPTYPHLVDPNEGVAITDSTRIVQHLYARYGVGEPPGWLFGAGFVVTSQLASVARIGTWTKALPSRAPEAQLVLSGHEADPGARRVRELLCALELPYLRVPGPLRFTDGEVESTDADAILAHVRARYSAINT